MATAAVAEKAIDVAADAAELVSEESATVAEVTRRLSPREVGLTFSGLGVGVVVGFAGGYFILRKRLDAKYNQIAEEEILAMREHYHRKVVALGEQETKEENGPDDVVEKLGYKAPDSDQIAYHNVGEKAKETPEPETENVFAQQSEAEGDGLIALNSEWDYETELKNRNPKFPYIIHQDEFREGPEGTEFEQYTLTYFEGDDVLCKEDDTVIELRDDVVGAENLSYFGHGSGDPNVVYIRNDIMKIDIEVTKSSGKYAVEVAGFQEDELQHSASMKRMRPRRSDYDDPRR